MKFDFVRIFTKCEIRKRGRSVVRHLSLLLEVPGSIPARGEEISVSEHTFSSVICRVLGGIFFSNLI